MESNKALWAKAAELVGEQELSRRFRVWCRGIIKKELSRRNENDPGELFLDEATAILNDLNERTGRQYRPGKENLALIRARMADGYGLEDFQKVHRVMCGKWLGDEKMRDYVRPSTLYRPGHFGEYLALAPAEKKGAAEKGQTAAGQTHRSAPTGTEIEEVDVAKLMARKWWEFQSWGEFVRWTMQFPSQEDFMKWPMPERVRRMRLAPMMIVNVLRGPVDWAEKEYSEIKKARENNEGNECR